jgi:hypothetical protein
MQDMENGAHPAWHWPTDQAIVKKNRKRKNNNNKNK